MPRITQSFRFCPQCGRNRPPADCNPFVCPDCEFTFFFNPAVAVAGIITDSADRILLLRRAHEPGKGQFGLPGGFVDPGESAEGALIREIREELNLELTEGDFFCSYPNMYTYKGVTYDVIDLFYICQVESLDPINPQASEVADWCFCHPSPGQLSNVAFPSNRRALEKFIATRS